jgi:acyl carrier protein
MVPASYVFLNRIPLSANGKIDRQALPSPVHSRPNSGTPFTPPQSLLQLQLQQIWEEVLGIHPVGIRDDFFDLGGDSLQTLIMMAMVERAMEKEITPEVVITGPTIEHLANYIQRGTEKKQHALVMIQEGGEKRAFYYLHGDYMSGGFYCLKLAHTLEPDRSYVLHPCMAGRASILSKMAAVHLRFACSSTGGYMLGGVCNGGLVAYRWLASLSMRPRK